MNDFSPTISVKRRIVHKIVGWLVSAAKGGLNNENSKTTTAKEFKKSNSLEDDDNNSDLLDRVDFSSILLAQNAYSGSLPRVINNSQQLQRNLLLMNCSPTSSSSSGYCPYSMLTTIIEEE